MAEDHTAKPGARWRFLGSLDYLVLGLADDGQAILQQVGPAPPTCVDRGTLRHSPEWKLVDHGQADDDARDDDLEPGAYEIKAPGLVLSLRGPRAHRIATRFMASLCAEDLGPVELARLSRESLVVIA